MLGRMVNLFGGKGAKEGIVSTVAVKGNRKATFNDTTGQIIDLGEEKVYELDMKKKTYKVATFAELRRRMEEAKAKAEQNAQKEQPREKGRRARAEGEQRRDRLRREGHGTEEGRERLRRAPGRDDDHGPRKREDARRERRPRAHRRRVAGSAHTGHEGSGRLRHPLRAEALWTDDFRRLRPGHGRGGRALSDDGARDREDARRGRQDGRHAGDDGAHVRRGAIGRAGRGGTEGEQAERERQVSAASRAA